MIMIINSKNLHHYDVVTYMYVTKKYYTTYSFNEY